MGLVFLVFVPLFVRLFFFWESECVTEVPIHSVMDTVFTVGFPEKINEIKKWGEEYQCHVQFCRVLVSVMVNHDILHLEIDRLPTDHTH